MLGGIDLICGIWVYNDELQIKFTFFSRFNDFCPLDFEIWPTIYLSPFYFTMISDTDLIFGLRVYNDKLPIMFEFRSDWMILG
jgi:hypothetical protein